MSAQAFEYRGEDHAEHGDRRNEHGQLVNIDVDRSFHGFRHLTGAAEQQNIHQRHGDATANDRHLAEGLHGRVHELDGARRKACQSRQPLGQPPPSWHRPRRPGSHSRAALIGAQHEPGLDAHVARHG